MSRPRSHCHINPSETNTDAGIGILGPLIPRYTNNLAGRKYRAAQFTLVLKIPRFPPDSERLRETVVYKEPGAR